ncbi:MAG TPA: hypothetical protein VN229_15425 [Terriglobales bacterium]|nr:hypothetical protein [Terriglobales bacterium]
MVGSEADFLVEAIGIPAIMMNEELHDAAIGRTGRCNSNFDQPAANTLVAVLGGNAQIFQQRTPGTAEAEMLGDRHLHITDDSTVIAHRHETSHRRIDNHGIKGREIAFNRRRHLTSLPDRIIGEQRDDRRYITAPG